MNSVNENINRIRDEIKSACQSTGRSIDSVKLMAVTKTKPPESVIDALNNGILYIGENKVQEGVDKKKRADQLLEEQSREQKPEAEWHFIGHLQRNKVKYCFGNFTMIQSVDSPRLLDKIFETAYKKKISMDILFEVNTSGESTKFGIEKDGLYSLIDHYLSIKEKYSTPDEHSDSDRKELINVKGLMTIGPFTSDTVRIIESFKNLRDLSEDCRKRYSSESVDFLELSMGMSDDYMAAIQEGATILRIGSAIFGTRPRLKPKV